MEAVSGGPPVVVSRLATAQARLGHRVEIVACNLGEDTNENILSLSNLIPAFKQVEICLIKPETLGLLLGYGEASATLEAHLARADIVHIHGVWDPILLRASRIAKTLGIPYALASHGMLIPGSLKRKVWKKKLALVLGYKTILKRAAFLHVLNENERAQIHKLHLNPRLEIIPNGVDSVDTTEPPILTDHPNQGRPYILFLGRLHQIKGLDVLADAFALVAAKNPDVDLLVAGPDYGAGKDLIQQVGDLGISDRVRLVGEIHGETKRNYLHNALCFCLPSRSEGFSIALLEALAHGLPVVISVHCHFPEVGSVGAGHVVKLNSTSLANALLSIVSNPESAKFMGEAARRLVEVHYTWPKIAEKTLDHYLEAINKSTQIPQANPHRHTTE